MLTEGAHFPPFRLRRRMHEYLISGLFTHHAPFSVAMALAMEIVSGSSGPVITGVIGTRHATLASHGQGVLCFQVNRHIQADKSKIMLIDISHLRGILSFYGGCLLPLYTFV